jgi:dihydrofolate synthase/folylpolyglutamate synthase
VDHRPGHVDAEPLEYLFGLERFGIKFGLDNIRTLVDDLGRPDEAFRSIHIAGTNGKGSVTAMVDAALRAAGVRSGRYTSPHLVDLIERFAIDGEPVSHETLVALVGELRDRISRLISAGRLSAQPTFFEVTTAAALELFRRAKVDAAVLEVGLGGRLDATNVITPVVTAITSIAFDHEKYLGHTLASIAAEKAGIIKPGVPVVVGPMAPESADAIAAIARERNAPLVSAIEGVTADRIPQPPGAPTRIRLRTPARDYGELTLSLRGAHQISNAIVAVRLLETLAGSGIDVPAASIAAGLAGVTWPGRLDHRWLPDGREVILDAAHNPAGAATLAAYLEETWAEKPPLVFAVMTDKDVTRMFEALLPAISTLVITRSSNARSADPASLAHVAHAIAPDLQVLIEPVRRDALAAAWSLSNRIVIAGSIFLLGDVMNEKNVL